MQAVRDGDVSKLGTLFERHHVALFDFLSRTMGDRAAAEDLVQDVFVRILRYRATYRDDGRFETWMFQIARNARADYARRRRPDQFGDEMPEPVSPERGQTSRLELNEDLRRLRCALMQLPIEKRELIVLARYRGMKAGQIASILRIEIGTVRVRLHRALNELRQVMHAPADEEHICDVKRYGSGSRTA